MNYKLNFCLHFAFLLEGASANNSERLPEKNQRNKDIITVSYNSKIYSISFDKNETDFLDFPLHFQLEQVLAQVRPKFQLKQELAQVRP